MPGEWRDGVGCAYSAKEVLPPLSKRREPERGVEPRLVGYKATVLPLYYPGMCSAGALRGGVV